MRFLILAAITVLYALPVSADNLPPTPKKAYSTLAVKAMAEVVPTKTKASSAETPSCCAPAAPMPPCSSMVDEAPLPPIPKKCYRRRCCNCCCDSRVQPIKFIANEFLRKPIYGVQKAVNDAEARRLCCMECRLKREAQRLSCEAARLAKKAAKTSTHDPLARLLLLEKERAYAARANRHAVNRARLDCQKACYCKRKNELKMKHAQLFPANE